MGLELCLPEAVCAVCMSAWLTRGFKGERIVLMLKDTFGTDLSSIWHVERAVDE